MYLLRVFIINQLYYTVVSLFAWNEMTNSQSRWVYNYHYLSVSKNSNSDVLCITCIVKFDCPKKKKKTTNCIVCICITLICVYVRISDDCNCWLNKLTFHFKKKKTRLDIIDKDLLQRVFIIFEALWMWNTGRQPILRRKNVEPFGDVDRQMEAYRI